MKKILNKKLTLFTSAALISSQLIGFATPIPAVYASANNPSDSEDLSDVIGPMFLEMIQRDADYCFRNATVADRLIESNDLDKYFDIFTKNLSSAKNNRNDLITTYGVSEDSHYITDIDVSILKIRTAIVSLAENVAQYVKDTSDSSKIPMAILFIDKTKTYLLNVDQLDTSSNLISALDDAKSSLTESTPNLIITEATSKINDAITSKSIENIKDALLFAKNAISSLIEDNDLSEDNDLIQSLNNKIDTTESNFPEFYVTESIDHIDNAMDSSDYSLLESIAKECENTKKILIETYYLSSNNKELLRLENAMSRLTQRMNNLNTEIPIDNILSEINQIIDEGLYTYGTGMESFKGYNDLISIGEKAISKKETLINNGISKYSKTIIDLDNAIQSLVSPLINAISNQFTSVIYQTSPLNFENLYTAGQNAINLKENLINNYNIDSNSNSIINLQNQINYMKRDLSAENITNRICNIIDNSESSSDINSALEQSDFARKHLITNLKLNGDNSELMRLNNKLVALKQRQLTNSNEDSPIVPLVENPNWYYTGMPEKILVREKSDTPETIIIDFVAKENMKIEKDRIEFIDQKEDDIFSETFHFWDTPGDFEGAVGYIGPDGILVESFNDIPDCPMIKSGEVVFSVVFENGGPFYKVPKLVNRSYWKLIKETRVGANGSGVNLTESITSGKSETESYSLAKTVSTSLDFGTKIGATAGAGGHQGAPSGGVSSDFSVNSSVSNSLSTTFGRSFTVSKQSQVAIRQNFDCTGVERKVGLYQFVEEFERDLYPANDENDFLFNLIHATKAVHVMPKIQTISELPTEHHTILDIEENQKDISLN